MLIAASRTLKTLHSADVDSSAALVIFDKIFDTFATCGQKIVEVARQSRQKCKL